MCTYRLRRSHEAHGTSRPKPGHNRVCMYRRWDTIAEWQHGSTDHCKYSPRYRIQPHLLLFSSGLLTRAAAAGKSVCAMFGPLRSPTRAHARVCAVGREHACAAPQDHAKFDKFCMRKSPMTRVLRFDNATWREVQGAPSSTRRFMWKQRVEHGRACAQHVSISSLCEHTDY